MITYYWSRIPGKFVNKKTGVQHEVSVSGVQTFPVFIGTVREWYETLVETLIDVHNAAVKDGMSRHDRPVTVTCSPDIGCMLECTILFKVPTTTKDPCPTCGHGEKVCVQTDDEFGCLAHRFEVKIDRTMPRNKIRVSGFGEVVVLDMPVIERKPSMTEDEKRVLRDALKLIKPHVGAVPLSVMNQVVQFRDSADGDLKKMLNGLITMNTDDESKWSLEHRRLTAALRANPPSTLEDIAEIVLSTKI